MKPGRTASLMLVAAALSLSLARPTPTVAQGYFSDVPKDHWAYNAVNELAARGILRGYPPERHAAAPARTPATTGARKSPSSSSTARPKPRRPATRSGSRRPGQ